MNSVFLRCVGLRHRLMAHKHLNYGTLARTNDNLKYPIWNVLHLLIAWLSLNFLRQIKNTLKILLVIASLKMYYC
jgi:hypothetical protein